MKYIWFVYSMQLVFLSNLLTFPASTNSRLSSQMKWHCKAKYTFLLGKGDIRQTSMKIGFILNYRSPAKLQKHNSLVSLSLKTKEMQKNSLKVAAEFKLVYFESMEMRHTQCMKKTIYLTLS